MYAQWVVYRGVTETSSVSNCGRHAFSAAGKQSPRLFDILNPLSQAPKSAAWTTHPPK